MTLRLFYKNVASDRQGYLFIADAQDYEHFINGFYQQLPSLSKSGREIFSARYNAVVQDCQRLNLKNKFFLMTPFALRNTWQSSFYFGSESYARMENLKDGVVYFNSPEWFLWANENLQVESNLSDINRAKSDLRRLRFHRLYMIWQGLRFILSRRASYKTLKKNSRFFIASIWTSAGFMKWVEQGKDPFYNDFPAMLHEEGYETVLVYHAEGTSRQPDISRPIPAFNFTAFLNLGGWLQFIWILLSFIVKTPNSPHFPKSAIKQDINNSLANQVPLALVSYIAAKHLLKYSPRADFITPYENNCWEQGILLAARELNRKVIGIQHTSIAPSFLKMDNHYKEKVLPDLILTSGAEPARILKDVMGHDPLKIKISGSLRHKISFSQKISSQKKILALLQGTPDDILFLHMLSGRLPADDIIVRDHPSWPIKNISSFQFSHTDIQTDLSGAFVAIYTGTTASFEALAAGVPVIHADTGSTLSSDPLFRLEDCAVKKTWNMQDNLKTLIGQIENLSEQERLAGFEKARYYIQDYFSEQGDIVNMVTHV